MLLNTGQELGPSYRFLHLFPTAGPYESLVLGVGAARSRGQPPICSHPALKPCGQVPRPLPLGASRDCQTAEPAGPHFPQPATPSLPLGAPRPILVSTLYTWPSFPRSLRGPVASAVPNRAAAAGAPQCRAGAPQCRAGARGAPSETDGAAQPPPSTWGGNSAKAIRRLLQLIPRSARTLHCQ